MSGLRGPVGHCEISKMHNDLPPAERPSAMYLAYAMPCETRTCDGRLICIGHAICPDCAAAIRAGRTEWAGTKNDVDLTMLHGAVA